MSGGFWTRRSNCRRRAMSIQAMEICLAALRVYPDSVTGRSLLSAIYEKKGDLDAAIRQMERVVDMNPESTADVNRLEGLRLRVRMMASDSSEPAPAWIGSAREMLRKPGVLGGAVVGLTLLVLAVGFTMRHRPEQGAALDVPAVVPGGAPAGRSGPCSALLRSLPLSAAGCSRVWDRSHPRRPARSLASKEPRPSGLSRPRALPPLHGPHRSHARPIRPDRRVRRRQQWPRRLPQTRHALQIRPVALLLRRSRASDTPDHSIGDVFRHSRACFAHDRRALQRRRWNTSATVRKSRQSRASARHRCVSGAMLRPRAVGSKPSRASVMRA